MVILAQNESANRATNNPWHEICFIPSGIVRAHSDGAFCEVNDEKFEKYFIAFSDDRFDRAWYDGPRFGTET